MYFYAYFFLPRLTGKCLEEQKLLLDSGIELNLEPKTSR